MKIAVDCRYLNKSGIGRVCEGLIKNFDYSANEFYLIGKKENLSAFASAHIIENDSNPFSAKGLFNFSKEINRSCDALITPNFIIPFGVKIPVFSVIHDLIFLDLKKMNKSLADKLIKRFLLYRCVKKSKKVFCVSQFTESRAKYFYKKFADKFTVNYNGLSDGVINYSRSPEKVKGALVYVGNVKPHKGLKTLCNALKLLPDGYTLKIIGERENFITGLSEEGLTGNNIEFTGRLSDERLLDEIASAELLIQPSEYEGFGLPPLEALYLGTKPVISDISVFKEVYEDFDVDFFKVGDEKDLAEKILAAKPLTADCRKQITDKYDYKKAADKIIRAVSEKTEQK